MEFGNMDGGFSEEAFSKEGGAVGSGKECGGRGVPLSAVEESDVGNGGVREITVAENDDVVGRIAQGESVVEGRAVGVFTRIFECGEFDALEGLDSAKSVGMERGFAMTIGVVEDTTSDARFGAESTGELGNAGGETEWQEDAFRSESRVEACLMIVETKRFATADADGFEVLFHGFNAKEDRLCGGFLRIPFRGCCGK